MFDIEVHFDGILVMFDGQGLQSQVEINSTEQSQTSVSTYDPMLPLHDVDSSRRFSFRARTYRQSHATERSTTIYRTLMPVWGK